MKTQQANKSEILANIKNLMKKTEIECSEEQYDKLATLVELLAKWNNALNLTAINKGKNIADVGTGAGFPGLVLAILNPQKHFTLIDSVAKKLSFVRTAMVSLGLKNVTIINDRCENIKVEQKFDCILSRAFAPLCKIIEWCENLIDDNGLFVAMKANLEEGELNELPENAEILENIPLSVPGLDAKRQAVVMRIKK